MKTRLPLSAYLALALLVLLIAPWIGTESVGLDHARVYLGGDENPWGEILFRQRIPRVVLGGAALAACDCVARTLMMWLRDSPTELPVGIITALVGGPLFIRLLIRSKTSW